MTYDATKDVGNARWDFHNPVRLVFGVDAVKELPAYVADRRALLITTEGFTRRGGTAPIVTLLGDALVKTMDTVRPNPELSDLEDKARMISDEEIDVIIALGGGSVVDSAKVLSATMVGAKSGFSLGKHLRTDGRELVGEGVPIIAIPTTAGTGSEVTPFATVWDAKEQKKYSLSGPQLLPEVALLDPSLSVSVPLEITIMTGLDAISQAFESIWNRNSTPITNMYATEALRVALSALPALATDLGNVKLRTEMLRASLFSGLAISHTRTALAHSMSYPLTSHYDMPHGLACSFTLAALLEFNAEADDGRLSTLSLTLGEKNVASLTQQVRDLMDGLHVKRLVLQYVGSLTDLHALVPEMITPGRADNNMRSASIEDLKGILARAWDDVSD